MQYENELGKHSGPGCVGGGKTMITPHIRFRFERWSMNKEKGAPEKDWESTWKSWFTAIWNRNENTKPNNFNYPWERGLLIQSIDPDLLIEYSHMLSFN